MCVCVGGGGLCGGVHDPAAVMGDPQGGRGLIGGAHDPAPVMGGTQGDVQGGGGLDWGGGGQPIVYPSKSGGGQLIIV